MLDELYGAAQLWSAIGKNNSNYGIIETEKQLDQMDILPLRKCISTEKLLESMKMQ